jgi:hypothetical protein
MAWPFDAVPRGLVFGGSTADFTSPENDRLVGENHRCRSVATELRGTSDVGTTTLAGGSAAGLAIRRQSISTASRPSSAASCRTVVIGTARTPE